jgi:hypothetical protein
VNAAESESSGRQVGDSIYALAARTHAHCSVGPRLNRGGSLNASSEHTETLKVHPASRRRFNERTTYASNRRPAVWVEIEALIS